MQDKIIKNARKQLTQGGFIYIKEVERNFFSPGFLSLFCFDSIFNSFKPLFYQTKEIYISRITENGFKIIKCDDDPRSVWGEFLLIGKKE